MTPTRLIFATLLSLSACSAAPTPTEVAAAELEGTWLSPCFPTSATQSAQTRIAYRELALTGTYSEYSDSACQTLRHVGTWTGTASNGAELRPGVRKLDLAFASFKSKPITQAEADLVNGYRYCGITDWAPGVERDILGRDCVNFAIPVGGKSLDIFQRDGETIRFGKGAKIAATLAESDRPTELDATPFARR